MKFCLVAMGKLWNKYGKRPGKIICHGKQKQFRAVCCHGKTNRVHSLYYRLQEVQEEEEEPEEEAQEEA